MKIPKSEVVQSPLQMIVSFVQQTATVIAAVLDVEVVILDEQLRVVAGTGVYCDSIGLRMSLQSVSAKVVEQQQPIIIANPRQHVFCRECSRREVCPDIAEICLPITMEEKVIGILAFVALNEEQKTTILNQQRKLVDFAARLSDLLSMAIRSRLLSDKLDYKATEFKTVINSVNDGIIAIDTAGVITQVNNPATKMLKASRDILMGKPITQVFSDPVIDKALSQQKVLAGKEIYSLQGAKKCYFLANLTHITDDNPSDITGYVLVIRNISEVNHIIGNYLMYERQITFDDIKSISTIMASAKTSALQVSQSDSTILIQGESGTGKELFARAIHSASPRCNGPFVALNCGAIPETLLESELFGYEDGAFSGAKRGGKAGRLELSNKGTIFLDEIGDLPLHLQVKLLRVFGNNVIDRIGGVRPIPIDVRIIAATNKDLQSMVARGEFREDLYYRLSVIPLYIPPLRNRREDIRVYIDHFINKFNTIMNKDIKGCLPDTMEKLYSWAWPGNVRELENAIEYASNMEQTSFIQLTSLPSRLQEKEVVQGKPPEVTIVPLSNLEKQAIIQALHQYGSSMDGKEAICNKLGIGIATLYRKVKEYQILLDDYRLRGKNQ